jgi:hypothetical protein
MYLRPKAGALATDSRKIAYVPKIFVMGGNPDGGGVTRQPSRAAVLL